MDVKGGKSPHLSEKANVKCRVCKTELRRKNYKAHLKAVHYKEDSGDLSGLSQNKLTSMLFRVGNRNVLRPTSEEEEPGGGSVSDDGRENFHDLEKHDDADKVDGGDGIDSFADVRHGESVKRTSQWDEEEDEQFKSLEEYSPLRAVWCFCNIQMKHGSTSSFHATSPIED